MNAEFAFLILGVSVLIHVTLVSVTLGVGVIAALYRFLNYRTGNEYYNFFARKSFKIMIMFELTAGVWGTIITVFLAGLFPNLLALATNVLFIPIIIAVIGIMIRIPSIALFWYSWNKISPKLHTSLGFVMALSGFVVPFGFRTIFAEITSPHAIGIYLNSGLTLPFSAFANPIFWILYLHTAIAAVSVGGFVVMSLMAHEKDLKGAMIGWKFGYYPILAQLVLGTIYWVAMESHSRYIFNSITFENYLPISVFKVALIVVLIFGGISAYISMVNGVISKYVKYLGFLPLLIAAIGELLNNGSRYPYMVVIDGKGLHVDAFLNHYIEMPIVVIYIILGFLLISLLIFTLALFYGIVKRYLEFPE